MALGGSRLAVVSALIGNSVVMVVKSTAFLFTGSGAMLSEAVHTLADLLNQTLLLIGIVRSERRPDETFQYGYGAERYVWALISAVGIFFLGCGVTVYHGVHSLIHPEPLSDLGWAVAALVFSFGVEFYVLVVAVRAVRAKASGKPFVRFLRTEADPSAVAVILEDFAACVGVVIALVAILLARFTGELYWDAIGSIVIGLLLGTVAIWLIWRNHGLLVGPAIPQEIRDQVRRILEENPAVEEVVDLRTRILDMDTYRIKADLKFDGKLLAQKLEAKIKKAHEGIRTYEDFKRFAADYADDVIELLGDEIDAIEKAIRDEVPKARHLDLEAD